MKIRLSIAFSWWKGEMWTQYSLQQYYDRLSASKISGNTDTTRLVLSFYTHTEFQLPTWAKRDKTHTRQAKYIIKIQYTGKNAIFANQRQQSKLFIAKPGYNKRLRRRETTNPLFIADRKWNSELQCDQHTCKFLCPTERNKGDKPPHSILVENSEVKQVEIQLQRFEYNAEESKFFSIHVINIQHTPTRSSRKHWCLWPFLRRYVIPKEPPISTHTFVWIWIKQKRHKPTFGLLSSANCHTQIQ